MTNKERALKEVDISEIERLKEHVQSLKKFAEESEAKFKNSPYSPILSVFARNNRDYYEGAKKELDELLNRFQLNSQEQMNKVTKEDLKGDIADFPIEVVQKMCERQLEQCNKFDPSTFAKDILSSFVWKSSPEGCEFWSEVIACKNFDLFFEKYPRVGEPAPEGNNKENDGENSMENELRFKVGDEVYVVGWDNIRVCVVSEIFSEEDITVDFFNEKLSWDVTQNELVEANEANYQLLTQLFPYKEIERPRVEKMGDEVAKAILGDSGFVICAVYNERDLYKDALINGADDGVDDFVVIRDFDESTNKFIDGRGETHFHAIPYDLSKFEPIKMKF